MGHLQDNPTISPVAASQRVTCKPEVPVVPRAGDLRAGDLRHTAGPQGDVGSAGDQEQDHHVRAWSADHDLL